MYVNYKQHKNTTFWCDIQLYLNLIATQTILLQLHYSNYTTTTIPILRLVQIVIAFQQHQILSTPINKVSFVYCLL